MARQASASYSLAAIYPAIAAQWHPRRNGAQTPAEVTPGSGRRVWWKCSKGPDHEWLAAVRDRRKHGCPCCAGKKACRATALQTLRPRLAREWHTPRNGALTARDVTLASNKVVWWRCRRDAEHEWRAAVAARAMRGTGCPFCAGRRASSRNSLATMAPAASRELHPTKNGSLRAEDLPAGSDRLVWWKCPNGPDHEWRTRVRRRGIMGRGCPYCGGALTSLQTSLQVRAPAYAAEWHPTRNGTLTPRDVGIGSKRRVWWRCRRRRDHEWQAMVKGRVHYRLGCPFCAGHRASTETSLARKYPAVAKQWHPSKNGALTPRDVLPGAARFVWWKCPKGPDHEWRAQVSERVRCTVGCPFCRSERLSVTNSVAALSPRLARWWHPTKNGRFGPADVRLADSRPVWWKCPKGPDHEWRLPPKVQRRQGCGFCAHRRVSVTNSLATRYPKIAAFSSHQERSAQTRQSSGRIPPQGLVALRYRP